MIGRFALYGFGEAINKSLPFIFLPILSHFLDTEAFGVLFAYFAATEFLLFVTGLNLNATLRPKFIKLKGDQFQGYLASGIFVVAASTGLLVVVAAVADHLFDIVDDPYLAALAPALAGFQAINLTYLSLKQISEQPGRYVAYSLVLAALNFGLSIALLATGEGWTGRVYGVFLANAVMGGAALVIFLREYAVRSSASYALAKTVIQDGTRLLPYSLSWWARSSLDRLIIIFFLGAHEAALFASASQYAMIVLVVGNIANQTIMPEIMRRVRDIEQGRPGNLAKVVLAPFGLVALACLTVAVGAGVFFDHLMSADYADAAKFVPLLCVVFLIQTASFLMINVLYYFEEYGVMSKIAVSTSILHVFLSVLFVNVIGLWGVVIAALISISVLLVLVSVSGGSMIKKHLVSSDEDSHIL